MTRSSQPDRRRARRVLTGTMAVAAAVTCALTFGSEGAVAASAPNAQSVGRFLDGSAGGKAIQSIADLKDARAVDPGSTSQQNPLDATLFNALRLPIGHALQLPGGGVFQVGAVNQVAVAQADGFSYGASGAVGNSGGASLGGRNGAFPADATIDLSSAALGSVPVPGLPGSLPGIPQAGIGGNSLPALGGIQAQIGAVSALAQTDKGGAFATPQYQIAGLKLALGSPALGGLLKTLAAGGKSLGDLLNQLFSAAGSALPKTCSLSAGTVPPKIILDDGAVTIDPGTATITVDVAQLLHELGLNINTLPPNTDLLAYVLNNLGTILSRGLEHVVDGILQPLQKLGDTCMPTSGLGATIGGLLKTLESQQPALEKAINSISDQLSSAGAPGLKQLTDNLAKVLAIGVNVQQGAFPLASEPGPKYRFSSPLSATPDQATAVVDGQGVVRALEIDLGGGQGASLALGNAAAGPSTPQAPTAAPPTHNPPTTHAPVGPPNTNIPTGIPAGMAGPGGPPTVPLTVLVVGLLIAGGGTVAWRMRAGRYRG